MGHLFVVQADLTRLVADDVIVPSDGQANFHPGFAALFADGAVESGTFHRGGIAFLRPLAPPTVVADSNGRLRSIPTASSRSSRIWLLDTAVDPASAAGKGANRTMSAERAEAAARGLTDRLETAIDAISAGRADASRQVLGLPLLGLSAGGFAPYFPDVVRRTLHVLQESISRHPRLDIVLVLRSRGDYAAVQHLRRATTRLPAGWEAVERHLDRLAELATLDLLVPFIGAGASAGAGLKGWWDCSMTWRLGWASTRRGRLSGDWMHVT